MNQNKNRKSIRIKNFNYSSPNDYFITVCVYDRGCLFGNIIGGEIILNDIGRMIEKWLLKLTINFPNISLDIFTIMPNHIHMIISILCEDDDFCLNKNIQATVGEPPCGLPDTGRAHGPAPTIPDIVAWFKTMTTNEYIRNVKNNNWLPFDKHAWQRSFHDHIIRNEKSYDEIYTYIQSNPQTWDRDRNNPKNL